MLPPMLSFSRCVRRESRYGMCERFVSVNAWMQLPSADSDWLMLFASCQQAVDAIEMKQWMTER